MTPSFFQCSDQNQFKDTSVMCLFYSQATVNTLAHSVSSTFKIYPPQSLPPLFLATEGLTMAYQAPWPLAHHHPPGFIPCHSPYLAPATLARLLVLTPVHTCLDTLTLLSSCPGILFARRALSFLSVSALSLRCPQTTLFYIANPPTPAL